MQWHDYCVVSSIPTSLLASAHILFAQARGSEERVLEAAAQDAQGVHVRTLGMRHVLAHSRITLPASMLIGRFSVRLVFDHRHRSLAMVKNGGLFVNCHSLVLYAQWAL